MTLAGKVALVTGATSGIGAACVREFATCGAAVMLAGRDAGRAAALIAELALPPARAGFVALDVRERARCDAAVAATVARFGRVDVLVNSAGIIHRGDALHTSDAAWLDVIAVNLSGTFWMCRAAIAAMRESGGGAIVNVASDWGLVAGKGHVAYCASKAGVVNMSRALALDHAADGIRVNAVCPGEVRTPMLASGLAHRGFDPDEGMAALGATIPVGRVSEPAEQARAIRFLASGDASYVTGAAISVDGGSTAH
ncbi:MAG: SDR family oxidoreductase [Alphaproteobacteria bacterium]|nr:SDR family oxidoreductase [Alphaproteobacteria bacterium]